MKPAPSTETSLYQQFQTQLNAVIAAGTPYPDAAEIMLTVALAAKVQADGAQQTARQLLLVTMGLAQSLRDNPQVLN